MEIRTFVCQKCGKQFERRYFPSSSKWGLNKCCSKSCSARESKKINHSIGEEIIKMYSEFVMTKDIANKYGINPTSVIGFLKRRGIKVRGNGETKKLMYDLGLTKTWNKGIPWSEETKKKIGESGKGRIVSPETGEKISLKLKGKPKPVWFSRMIGDRQRGKPRLNMRGSNHPNWKGGVSRDGPGRKEWWTRAEYKEWRRKVFERDNYVCQKCYKRGGYLEAHHLKSFTCFPELRFDINNGVTLCKGCHLIETKSQLRKAS